MKINKKTSRLELAAIVTEALEKNDIKAVLVGGAVVSIYTDNEYESKDLDFISPADHKKITKIMHSLGFSAEGKIKVGTTTVILLSTTQSAMDRLAWFYFNNDRQCLDQAVMIAKRNQSCEMLGF